MKLSLTAAAAVAALGMAAGTASAQYQTLVPHRGHYHAVPSYSYAPSVYGGYGYPGYSQSSSFGAFYASPGITIGGSYYSPGYDGGWGGGHQQYYHRQYHHQQYHHQQYHHQQYHHQQYHGYGH